MLVFEFFSSSISLNITSILIYSYFHWIYTLLFDEQYCYNLLMDKLVLFYTIVVITWERGGVGRGGDNINGVNSAVGPPEKTLMTLKMAIDIDFSMFHFVKT